MRETTLDQAHGRADWRRVESIYGQLSEILDDREEFNEPPIELSGSLAESLGRVFAAYDGEEDVFALDFLAVMADVDGRSTEDRTELFRDYYCDPRFGRLSEYRSGEGVQGKRRPTPFEATVETARRLSDLNRIRDQLYPIPTSCILGGSASYGRFFNASGNRENKASDMDILVVVADYNQLADVLDALAKMTAVGDADKARARAGKYGAAKAQLDPDVRCLFSHKLPMWRDVSDERLREAEISGRYRLSLHVISDDDLSFVMLGDIPIVEDGLKRVIWDFRDTEPEREDNQRSFAGTDQTVDRERIEVDGGWLGESYVCHVEEDRFYPGLHQNLILPQFDLRWEMPRRRMALRLLTFRWKIVERLRREKATRPFEVQSVSLSHTRSAAFAPHIVRRVDSHA